MKARAMPGRWLVYYIKEQCLSVCLSVCVSVCLSGVGVQTVHPIDFKLGTIVEEHPRSVLSLLSIF